MNLDAAIDSFAFHLKVERNISANTVEAHTRDLRKFAEDLEEDDAVGYVRSIDPLHISGFMKDLLAAHVPRASPPCLNPTRCLAPCLIQEHRAPSQ